MNRVSKVKNGLYDMDRTEWWLISLTLAFCTVPAYMVIWGFHLFFQVALVPLAYTVLVLVVVALVAKACILVVSVKRKLKLIEENSNGS